MAKQLMRPPKTLTNILTFLFWGCAGIIAFQLVPVVAPYASDFLKSVQGFKTQEPIRLSYGSSAVSVKIISVGSYRFILPPTIPVKSTALSDPRPEQWSQWIMFADDLEPDCRYVSDNAETFFQCWYRDGTFSNPMPDNKHLLYSHPKPVAGIRFRNATKQPVEIIVSTYKQGECSH